MASRLPLNKDVGSSRRQLPDARDVGANHTGLITISEEVTETEVTETGSRASSAPRRSLR